MDGSLQPSEIQRDDDDASGEAREVKSGWPRRAAIDRIRTDLAARFPQPQEANTRPRSRLQLPETRADHQIGDPRCLGRGRNSGNQRSKGPEQSLPAEGRRSGARAGTRGSGERRRGEGGGTNGRGREENGDAGSRRQMGFCGDDPMGRRSLGASH